MTNIAESLVPAENEDGESTAADPLGEALVKVAGIRRQAAVAEEQHAWPITFTELRDLLAAVEHAGKERAQAKEDIDCLKWEESRLQLHIAEQDTEIELLKDAPNSLVDMHADELADRDETMEDLKVDHEEAMNSMRATMDQVLGEYGQQVSEIEVRGETITALRARVAFLEDVNKRRKQREADDTDTIVRAKARAEELEAKASAYYAGWGVANKIREELQAKLDWAVVALQTYTGCACKACRGEIADALAEIQPELEAEADAERSQDD